mgnify:CR=1 FL=1
MKAIILNSGIGKRMGKLTENKPKCLVEIIDGVTILRRQIEILYKLGIDDFIITTGPYEEKIRAELSSCFSGLKIEFVNNNQYESTNYIYSISLIPKLNCDEIIILHGDLVFDEGIIERVLNSDYDNSVVVNSNEVLSEKDFIGRVIDEKVVKIGVNIENENVFNLYPLYKLSIAMYNLWCVEMNRFIGNGMVGVYAEDALNNLLGNGIDLRPVYIKHELCAEVDDIYDLEVVKKCLADRNC